MVYSKFVFHDINLNVNQQLSLCKEPYQQEHQPGKHSPYLQYFIPCTSSEKIPENFATYSENKVKLYTSTGANFPYMVSF